MMKLAVSIQNISNSEQQFLISIPCQIKLHVCNSAFENVENFYEQRMHFYDWAWPPKYTFFIFCRLLDFFIGYDTIRVIINNQHWFNVHALAYATPENPILSTTHIQVWPFYTLTLVFLKRRFSLCEALGHSLQLKFIIAKWNRKFVWVYIVFIIDVTIWDGTIKVKVDYTYMY